MYFLARLRLKKQSSKDCLISLQASTNQLNIISAGIALYQG